MGDCFITRRGGGVGLNFKIEAYASLLLLPAVADENTFAVITSTPITAYAFSYDEPDNPQNGMVWFKQAYSSKSGFNALKKNDIHVYPASARQRINGVWEDKDVRAYQGGEWREWWDGQLYTPGNEYSYVTGGWYSAEYSPDVGYPPIVMDVTRRSDSLFFYGTFAPNNSSSVTHQLAVDVSEYSTLTLELSTTITANSTILCRLNEEDGTGIIQYPLVDGSQAYSGTFTVDVSNINRKIIVSIPAWAWSTVSNITITLYRVVLS